MVREPSVDPYRLILGEGTAEAKENELEHISPRDQQMWVLENADGKVIDIERYDTDLNDWVSLLGEHARSVSGISPVNGDVPQVIEVTGPDPNPDGASYNRQVGLDYDRNEIYAYLSGAWRQIASLDSALAPTRTHNLDPSVNQVADPTVAPTATDNGGSGNLS